MKILYLLTQDLESPSGLGRFFPMAREMSLSGHQVTIVALHSDFGSLEQRQFVRDGVNVWYVGQMQVLKKDHQKIYFPPAKLLLIMLKSTWAMIKAVLSTPTEIIHICKPHPMNSLAGLAAKVRHRCILFVDCDDYEAGSSNFSNNFQKSIVTFFEKNIPRQAAYVTTHTHFMMNKLIQWKVPEKKIYYLSNGVWLERFPPADPGELDKLRKVLELENTRVIAFIGTLSLANHPVELLLKALLVIREEIPNAVLILVGGGEDYYKIQAMVKQMELTESVRFCGRVSPKEVYLYYNLADVSVDPVHADGAALGRSPLKLFESWAANVPFVTADVGERRFLLGEPPAGLLARPGHPESLAECILEILQSPDLAQNYRYLGKQRVVNYSWKHLSVVLNNIYEQAAQAERIS